MTEKSKADLVIRRAVAQDIWPAAKVHELAFPRQTFSHDWLDCVFRSFPKSQLFVAERAGEIVGLIFWTEKSGFRKEAVVELEQIAVHPNKQSIGIGTQLIMQSLPLVAEKIAERGAKLGHVLINTRVDNYSQELYRKTLGARPAAVVSGLFTADEVFMVAHNIDLAKLQTKNMQKSK